MSDLIPGCKIFREKLTGLGNHYGIYLGINHYGVEVVAHNAEEAGVCCLSLGEFSSGKQVYIEQYATPGTENKIVKKAEQLIGTPYDFFNFNCEHFATHVQEGETRCSQFEAIAAVAAAATVVVAVVALVASSES